MTGKARAGGSHGDRKGHHWHGGREVQTIDTGEGSGEVVVRRCGVRGEGGRGRRGEM